MKATARQALALTAIVWLIISYGSYVVAELVAGRTGFIRDLPLDLPAVLIVAMLAFGLYPIAYSQEGRPPVMRWIVVLIAAVAVAFAQSVVNLIENWLLGVIPQISSTHISIIRQRFGRSFLSHLYMCIATGALFIFLIEARRTEIQRSQRLRAERIASDARMAALSLQMNPHFLFNALNGISSLILSGAPEAAEEMVGLLSEFLRRSLRSDPSLPVPLKEEVATVALYMQIERVRFEERLLFELEVPETLLELQVLPFLLQPLAENAVKYGVAHSRTPVLVRASASIREELLILRVEDNAKPANEVQPGLGIGIENIRERLVTRYGPAASISAQRFEGGFVSEIRIPVDQ